MSVPVNLYLLCKGIDANDLTKSVSFENRLSKRTKPKDRLDSREIASLNCFVDNCLHRTSNDLTLLDGFAYSYSIPHIPKEFDLLKITDHYAIDVELKSEPISADRLIKQLHQNAHYLASLQKTTFCAEYIASENLFYVISPECELQEMSWDKALSILRNCGASVTSNYDYLFKPSDYLISPINNTDRFVNDMYFLTDQQASIKRNVLENLEKDPDGTGRNISLIIGGAGTGKTLLLYDIAKSLPESSRACVIHCGYLAEGHHQLSSLLNNVDIIPAKKLTSEKDLELYDAVFVDEAQRIYPGDLLTVLKTANNKSVIFSLDQRQCLSASETSRNVMNHITCLFSAVNQYELTQKIRTNRNLADFIRVLFGLKPKEDNVSFDTVDVFYANSPEEAWCEIGFLEQIGYTYVPVSSAPRTLSPLDAFDQRPNQNTHRVIGQEFDMVTMLMDGRYFFFGEDGKLKAQPHPNPDYLLPQLLFQGLTRAREKVAIIVLGSRDLFGNLLAIVSRR